MSCAWPLERSVMLRVPVTGYVAGQVTGPAQDFATGWLLNNNDAVGRPVGLAR